MDFSDRKVGKLMQYANQIQATYVIIIGDNELQSGEVEVKEMSTGEKYKLPLKHIPQIFEREKHNESFLNSMEEVVKPFSNPAEANFFIKRIEKNIQDTTKAANNLQKAMLTMQELLK
jgi:histidyl-tRNA synthetase